VKKIVLVLALVLLAVGPAFAADRVIYNGSDLWTTPGDGRTFADFSASPIPAGFFCPNSDPFMGRIVFKGTPLAMDKPGTTDTVVQRLDDAAFNKAGVATTRIQVRALSLESVGLIKTNCGSFKAVVSLQGEQPITRMRIFWENEKGGRYLAPLALNVRISFVPEGAAAVEKLEIRQQVRFPATPNAWNGAVAGVAQEKGFIRVDTDGDRVADTFVPGTSNFVPGAARTKVATPQQQYSTQYTRAELEAYHTAPTHAHLVTSIPASPSLDSSLD
jgi:hypothetical protein